jgi:preprotein translocase subunit SecE
MGKLKNENAGTKSGKSAAPSKPSMGRTVVAWLAPFLANLLQTTSYKPNQGWYARLWTGIGMGALLLVGVYRLFDYMKSAAGGQGAQLGVPALVLAALGWLIYRVLHYPPFVDFLIATEAEMNKVSWTSKADLYRATTVVLVTVLLMSVYLFGVDYLWMTLLQLMGVLKFSGGGAFGSTA